MGDLEAKVRALECWARRDITVKPLSESGIEGLGEGRTNHNFVVTVTHHDGAERKFFVRLGDDLPAYGVSRKREEGAMCVAAAQGIGAGVIHTEPGALVQELLPGKALTAAEVKAALAPDGDAPLLKALASTLRKLHGAPMPPEIPMPGIADRKWAPPDLLRWLTLAKDGGYTRIPIVADAEALLGAVDAFLGTPPCAAFCHFDLLPDNFVVEQEGPMVPPDVKIVDFEYANSGPPLMDLTIFSMGCELTVEEETVLLTSYYSEPAIKWETKLPTIDDAFLAKFGALKVLACLRETLWGVVAEVSGTSALSASEAIAYTDLNYAKLGKARALFEASKVTFPEGVGVAPDPIDGVEM